MRIRKKNYRLIALDVRKLLAEQGIPLLPIETLDKDLNSRLKTASFPASALTGTNVVTTMKKIISMTMSSIIDELK